MSYRVAVLASGNGTNAERLFEYFQDHPTIKIAILLSNNPRAKALERAKKWKIPSKVFTKNDLDNSPRILNTLKDSDIDWIILAGFVWLIPVNIVSKYPNRIVNIHPALLPKYGGKDMYGKRVHEEVLKSGDEESGITIHLVNEEYDKGRVLFQATCPIEKGETVESLTKKVHELEYEHYPFTVEGLILRTEKVR